MEERIREEYVVTRFYWLPVPDLSSFFPQRKLQRAIVSIVSDTTQFRPLTLFFLVSGKWSASVGAMIGTAVGTFNVQMVTANTFVGSGTNVYYGPNDYQITYAFTMDNGSIIGSGNILDP